MLPLSLRKTSKLQLAEKSLELDGSLRFFNWVQYEA